MIDNSIKTTSACAQERTPTIYEILAEIWEKYPDVKFEVKLIHELVGMFYQAKEEKDNLAWSSSNLQVHNSELRDILDRIGNVVGPKSLLTSSGFLGDSGRVNYSILPQLVRELKQKKSL